MHPGAQNTSSKQLKKYFWDRKLGRAALSVSEKGIQCYNTIMKIALLGYGKEGKSTEAYFKKHYSNLECEILENFTYDEIKTKDFSGYDYVFRSPSVPPLHLTNETSATKYFFDHCPCPIIGVTATKGKGTTCSFIKSILDSPGA